jgi:hypothetical protein
MITAAPKKKRKKPFNATRRAMDDLKAMGFSAWVVESRIPHTFITRDCFGFADILAHRRGVGILLIQATAGRNHASRRTKIFSEEITPAVAAWLASGGRVEIWSYDQSQALGASKDHILRREEITIADLPMIHPDEQAAAGLRLAGLNAHGAKAGAGGQRQTDVPNSRPTVSSIRQAPPLLGA